MATEAQIAAMAKARAARKPKVVNEIIADEVARFAMGEPDPAEAARIAAYSYTLKIEHPGAEPEAPCLDPEIAFDRPVESTDEAPLIAAARQMLKCVELRRGDGTIMNECCQLCEDTGIHHTVPYRCSCGCHPLREALGV